ncbi:MAG: DUF2244 domain-containing protein [Pseudomonadota bacterium]
MEQRWNPEQQQTWRHAWCPEWRHEWLLKRNCSLTPRQLAQAFGALCLATLAIGLVFAVQGIWFVFLFSLVEIAGIALALLHYARHVCDHEHIALSGSCLLVERVEAGKLHQVLLDPSWTKIVVPDGRRALIRLESRGVAVDVGALIPEHQRTRVALEIRRALRSSSYLA